MGSSNKQLQPLPSSYRDPSGYVFEHGHEIYRQVNKSFQTNFERFHSSGLYDELVKAQLLISHQVIAENLTGEENWYTTLKPEMVDVISYPYEWTFSMLKDAALLTLQLALKALEHGMILKDASPYNIQFHKGRMVFIDSLSFEIYKEAEPWIAYRQFCESFVGPLALMHYTGLPLQNLFLAYPDGIPLAIVKSLLPFRSKLNLYLYLHVHLHASYSQKKAGQPQQVSISKQKLVNLLRSLESLIRSFRFTRFENVWGNYYAEAETRSGYLEEKKAIISLWVNSVEDVQTVIDIGGNEGEFAKLVSKGKRRVICADGEHFSVDKLYNHVKEAGTSNLLPLSIDFSHPSPAIGVNNQERDSFYARANSDLAMALALVHHLAIGKNISFDLIAKMCAALGRTLIIEFVTKEDEKALQLLRQKKDIYHWYTEENFVAAFSTYFRLISKRPLSSSPRTLYLMERL